MKKSFLGLIFSSCAFSAFAGTNTWVSGSTDWRSADSYLNESGEHVLPGANDFILVPKNVSLSLTVAEDFTFLSSIRGILLRQGAQLTVYVPSEGRTLGCAIRNYDVNCGTVVKTGEGVLNLSSPGNLSPGQYSNYTYDYQCGFDIREGDIRFFSNGVNTGKSNIWALFSTITVAEGCKAYFPTVDGQISPHQVFCKGDFVNEGTSDLSLTLNSYYGAINEFSGKLVGKWKIRNVGGSRITGTDNRYKGTATVSGYKGSGYVAGTLFLTAFGTPNDDTKPSSIGTDTWISLGDTSGNAQLIYLGEGETVTKTFGVNSTANGPFVMDAGANGGLDFTSNLWRNFASGFVRAVLTGSNRTECVISPYQFEPATVNGIRCNWQITKRGSGTWRFQTGSTARDGLGMVAVEEGALKFDTLKEKGEFCAFGYATNLFENLNAAAIDESKRVPYAFKLGGTTNAVLEYTGADLVRVTDRPIGLAGGVSHVRSSGSGALRLCHAGGVVSGSHTLVLDGTNGCENVFSTITNGVGTVNVVKDGPGSWTLAGEQSFSGTLEVKDGTLTLLSPETYSFYKWIFKEVAGNCSRYADTAGTGTKNVLTLGELALYDANGNRQNLGITDAASMSVLTPGTATYDHDAWPAVKWSDWGNSPTDLFNGRSYHYADGKYVNDYEFNVINLGDRAIMLGDKTRWLSLVCRLTNATPEIASYDIGYKYGCAQASWASSTVLTAYEIRGSVDGLVWDELAVDDEVDAPDAAHKWLSDKAGYYNNAARKVTGNGDCFPLRGKPERELPFLSNITGFAISGGATVQASCPIVLPDGIPVTIDASSGKTASISGLVFGSSGTLKVVNAEKGKQVVLPVEFNDDSYVNLANYDLELNGKPNARYKVTAKDGKLTLEPSGLLLIVK